MAERDAMPPSMEGIFDVLAQIPHDRLLRYLHKLEHLQQDRRIVQLLRTLILLTLRREAEARASLDTLGYDLVAATIFRSHWGSSKGSKADLLPPKQDAEVALTVARIYSLLVDEKLCDPKARDEGYRAAIHAFRASHVEPARLKSLLDKVQDKCGVAFASTLSSSGFGVLAADPVGSPALPEENHPEPIQSSLDPLSLRSTGTPVSFLSHFEISPATTMAFVTDSDQEPSAGTGKVCGSPSAPLGPESKRETGPESPISSFSKIPSVQDSQLKDKSTSDSQRPPCLPDVAHPQVSWPVEAQRPVPCTEPPSTTGTGFKGGLPQNLETSSTLRSSSPNSTVREPQAPKESLPQNLDMPVQSGTPSSAGWSPKSTEGPSRPTGKTDSKLNDSSHSAVPSLSTESSPADPLADENRFYSFVVLHAGEDEEVAWRVKERLEGMGVSNGATYSEDFLIPGHCQLGCFQNALDNTAFTLLLLTKNFHSRFCAYQTSVALMDSFQRFCKINTVIPFVPKENPIPKSEMPTVLAGIVPLDENSPVFGTRVRKTFTPRVIREKEAMWSAMRQIRERQEQEERDREYQQMLRDFAKQNIDTHPPGPPTGFPGFQPGRFPPPSFPTPFPASGMGQHPLGPDPASLSQPFLVSLGSGGPQPQFIIQNAQMIQIGDYNHMQAERNNGVLGAADDGVQEG